MTDDPGKRNPDDLPLRKLSDVSPKKRVSVLTIERGQAWEDGHGLVRVMTVVDGYVMARRPHCSPFVESIAAFETRFGYVGTWTGR